MEAIATILSCTSRSAVSKAANALEAGAVVVIPTDTVYGLAARLDRPGGIRRIFKLKGRPRSKPLPILVPDVKAARRLGEFTKDAMEMAMRSWPGPVTLVLASLDEVPDIGGDGTSVGLRVPDHPFALELMHVAGPLAATSANPSGAPTGATLTQVLADLGDGPALYIDGGVLDAAPSRVLSFVGPGTTVLRT